MFLKYINENNLINKNDKIIIAFSTGPDSFFLLEKLLEIKDEYNLELHLAYVNHNTRKEIVNEIKLVKETALKYSITYSILEIKMDKFSENLARNLRYKILEKLRKDLSYNKIATGHNKTDSAETIIFNILRGSGINGIKGIVNQRGNIIRPILYISKKDVLNQVKNKYSIDKSNLENKYSRNKIRNLIFPIFEEINGNFINNILKLYSNIEKNEIKENLIKEFKKRDIEIKSNKINEILKLINKNGSKKISLGNGYYWYKTYNSYDILKEDDFIKNENVISISLNEEIEYNDYIIGITNSLEKKLEKHYNILEIENFEKSSKLIIRTRRNGDRLGNKKIKEIFINEKIDKLLRDKMPLILHNENILMIGDRFKIKNTIKNSDFKIYVGRKNEKK